MRLLHQFLLSTFLVMAAGGCKTQSAISESSVKNVNPDGWDGDVARSFHVIATYANPPRILMGQSTTLYWCFFGADFVIVEDNLEQRYPPCQNGLSTLQVYPTGPRDYVLVAFRGEERIRRLINVNVYPMPGLVMSLSANPPVATEGQVVEISWQTLECDYVLLTDETNAQFPPYSCGSGSHSLPLNETKTFILRAFRRGDGQLNIPANTPWQDQLVGMNSVRVEVTKRPPQVFFDAQPREVFDDEPVNLTWAVQNADRVTISPNLGAVPIQGSQRVPLNQTTEFRLEAVRNTGQTMAQSVVVKVNPKLRVESVSVLPSSGMVERGSSVNFSWNTKWCRHVRLELASGERVSMDRACVDSFAVTPDKTNEYVVRIEDLYGAVQKIPYRVVVVNEPRVAIPITAPTRESNDEANPPAPTPAAPAAVMVGNTVSVPEVIDFAANRTEIMKGETIRLTWSTAHAKRTVIKFPRRTVVVGASGEREFKVLNSGVIEVYAENAQYRSVSKKIQVTVTPRDLHEELLLQMQGKR